MLSVARTDENNVRNRVAIFPIISETVAFCSWNKNDPKPTVGLGSRVGEEVGEASQSGMGSISSTVGVTHGSVVARLTRM